MIFPVVTIAPLGTPLKLLTCFVPAQIAAAGEAVASRAKIVAMLRNGIVLPPHSASPSIQRTMIDRDEPEEFALPGSICLRREHRKWKVQG